MIKYNIYIGLNDKDSKKQEVFKYIYKNKGRFW